MNLLFVFSRSPSNRVLDYSLCEINLITKMSTCLICGFETSKRKQSFHAECREYFTEKLSCDIDERFFARGPCLSLEQEPTRADLRQAFQKFIKKPRIVPLEEAEGEEDDGSLDQDILMKYYSLAKWFYYTRDLSIMTDAEFDKLEKRLPKKLRYVGPPTADDSEDADADADASDEDIGISRSCKGVIPYFMGSLDPLPLEKYPSWMNRMGNKYVIEEKIDGTSALFQYSGGQMRLMTRGGNNSKKDEYTGTDISFALKYLQGIPSAKSIKRALGDNNRLFVRGELVMTKDTFAKISDGRVNARATVSGLVNSKLTKDTVHLYRATRFLAYELVLIDGDADADDDGPSEDQTTSFTTKIEPTCMRPSKQLKMMDSMGFFTVGWKKITADDLESPGEFLHEQYAAILENGEYEADGLVVFADTEYTIEEKKYPAYAKKYKEVDELHTVKVTGVKWKTGKGRNLVPTITFKRVTIDGKNYENVTGSNARRIKDERIGKGAVINISINIVPVFKGVVTKAKRADFPEDEEWEWDEGELHIRHVDDERMEKTDFIHFFKTMNIPGVGEKWSVLWDHRPDPKNKSDTEFKTVSTVIQMLKHSEKKNQQRPDYLREVTDAMFAKMVQVPAVLRSCSIVKLMLASNCFNNIGESRLTTLCKTYPTVDELMSIEESDIIRIPKFGEKIAAEITEGMERFQVFVRDNELEEYVNDYGESSTDTFEGMKVVFTGIRDAEAIETLTKNGGATASSVSRNTTHVVDNRKDPTKDAKKLEKAAELDIPVLTMKKFKSMMKRMLN